MAIHQSEERELYDTLVFQDCDVRSLPDDRGMIVLSTVDADFTVLIDRENAEQIIDQLQDFLKGRAPSILRDDN